jgi:hypothetical protein
MFARIGNLILASLFLSLVVFFFLGMIWPDNWRLLSPPPPSVEPRPFYDTVAVWTSCVLVICVWMISAAFLFDRCRFAWFGSLFGVGSAICLFVCLLVDLVWEGLFSSRVQDSYLSGAAFIIGMLSAFSFLIVWLTFSVAIFIGLIKNRKELIHADDA